MAYIGQQFGEYCLTERIGTGGTAIVYRGRRVQMATTETAVGEDVQMLPMEVAIKVLKADVEDELIKRNFKREVEILARLHHPHIIHIIGFGVEDIEPYITMDYAPGGNFAQMHPLDRPLSYEMISCYVEPIADALHYAHTQNIIHCDLKPQNILMGSQDTILLGDFGYAHVIQTTQQHSSTSGGVTWQYTAPEQINPKRYGKRSHATDQYALAIMAYQWLCGHLPFNGETPELMYQHLTEEPPSLSRLVPTVSPLIESVILKALTKQPQDRYPDIRTFASSLKAALQPPAPLVVYTLPPVPFLQRTEEPAKAPIIIETLSPQSAYHGLSGRSLLLGLTGATSRRLPRRTVLLGLAGATLVGTSAIIMNTLYPSQIIPIPFFSFSSPTPLPIDTRSLFYSGHSGTVSSVAWSPNGTRIASAGYDRTVQVWDAATGAHPFIYKGHFDSVLSAVWSPNGTRIASAGYDHTVQVWDAATGVRLFIYKGHAGLVPSAVWSPNGTRIASAGYDHTVQVWDAATGTHPFTYQGHTSSVLSVAWSPDSTRIASAGYDHTVQVWDATTGSHPFIYQGHTGSVASVAWSPDSTRISSAGYDGVQVWDATTGAHAFTYKGYAGSVLSTAWSPNGTHIASAGYDQTVQLWDATTGAHFFTYKGHVSPVLSVAWSPNGTRIASAGGDGVQVWSSGL